MAWSVRPLRYNITREVMEMFYELCDDQFTIKLHVGGTFCVNPTLNYVGGSTTDIDYLRPEVFDIRDLDEFALRSGYAMGSSLLYAYREPGWSMLIGLKRLMSVEDIDVFKDLSVKNKFLEVFIDSTPTTDVCSLYTRGMPLRVLENKVVSSRMLLGLPNIYVALASDVGEVPLLSNEPYDVVSLQSEKERNNDHDRECTVEDFQERNDDIQFFREGDRFDVELDDEINQLTEIRKPTVPQAEFGYNLGEDDMPYGNCRLDVDDIVDAPTCSNKQKQVGTYARHGLHFKKRKEAGYIESDSDAKDDWLSESASEYSMRSTVNSSDEEGVMLQDRKNIRYVYFNEKDIRNPKFFPGLVFSSKKQMKEVVSWYAVLHHKPLWIATNDNRRYAVRCEYPCNFSMWISKDKRLSPTDWCVKAMRSTHSGCPDKRIKLCNSTFIAKALEDKFRLLPDLRLAAVQVFVHEMFHEKIGSNVARRAKEKALLKIEGDHVEQYNMIHTYCKELMDAHPGSTCFIESDTPTGIFGANIFKRIYICLKPLVDGFHDGCRKVIGLDGCHTKGTYKQQILTAVALDSNNGYWPIAWAVVEKENADTWEWFLQYLRQDVGIYKEEEYVFISDKQKGLERVIHEQFPYVAHRNCVQHIYANFKKENRGQHLRDRLWEVARSTNKQQFKRAMNSLKDVSTTAHTWLIEHAGKTTNWCRAYFPLNVYSDMLCNNLSESFNSFIVPARDKPIITMLEMIRSKIMGRIKNRRLAMSKKPGVLCVKIQKIVERNRQGSVGTTIIWNGKTGFEVKDSSGNQFSVDIGKKNCSCGSWQLSGIPCPHAIPCLYELNVPLDEVVSECYRKETFMRTYNHVLNPVNGMDLWDNDAAIPLQPPPHLKLAGRPKKSRNKDKSELKKKGRKQMLQRWTIIHCSWCGEEGHNIRGCPRKKNGEEAVKRPAITKRPREDKPKGPALTDKHPAKRRAKVKQEARTTNRL